MSPPRKFDWDEARRRRAAGEKISDLATEFGVSRQAVVFAVDDRARSTNRLLVAERQRRLGNPHNYDACECGARKAKRAKKCQTCRTDDQRGGQIADDRGNILCAACHEYRPVSDFGFSPRDRLFRRTKCRSCETKTRKAYRERHKVPCSICGAPALPASEKGPRGLPEPRCLACFRKSMRREERDAA